MTTIVTDRCASGSGFTQRSYKLFIYFIYHEQLQYWYIYNFKLLHKFIVKLYLVPFEKKNNSSGLL